MEIYGDSNMMGGVSGGGTGSHLIVNFLSGTTYTLMGNGKTFRPIGQIPTQAIYSLNQTGTYTFTATNRGITLPFTINITAMNQSYTMDAMVSDTFFYAPWSYISQVAKSGTASSAFNINDRRMINIAGKSYEFAIMGFDNYDAADSSAYGRTKVGITIGMVNCLNTTHNIDSATRSEGGWGKPYEIKTWLNGLSLDSDLSSVITYGKLPYCATYNKSTMSYDTTSKLFLPSYAEVYGNDSYDWEPKAKEGSQFAYYANGGSKIKTISGYASIWWLRSVQSGNSDAICRVMTDGSTGAERLGVAYGVAPCFCV